MMEINDGLKPCGFVQGIIDYKSGEREIIEFKNAILTSGREALASCLARNIGDGFNFYINRMLFGDGGTSNGSTKVVSTSRNGLFGITQASKPVIASVDPNIPSQVIFTSVISFSEANGAVLNEMALQMATGNLYSMVTFPDLTKTSQLQLTFNWRLSFV
jgi:hypothetical protein